MVSLKFFIDIILPAALWFWGWLSNDYQEYFLQGKGGRCVGLTNLPLSCADYLEIREPQSPGNLRACPGMYRYCFTLLLADSMWLNVQPKVCYENLMSFCRPRQSCTLRSVIKALCSN